MSLDSTFPGRRAISVPEFRAAYGFSESFVATEIAAGRLAVIGQGKSRRITLDVVRDWENRSSGPAAASRRGPFPRRPTGTPAP